MSYPQDLVGAAQSFSPAIQLIGRTLAERTRDDISRLEDELVKRRELLALLEKNPDIERVITLASQVRSY